MEEELLKRLNNIEDQISKKKNDFWSKIPILTPILIPLSISLIGWYFTNQYNLNQLEIQKENDSIQVEIALINASVNQAELIRDYMVDLTGKDTSIRNIAIEAVLYAAPNPGKRIVEIIAKTGNSRTREVVEDAFSSKRKDLINSVFSSQKQQRLFATEEIITNWINDKILIKALIDKALSCNKSVCDCSNGIYNTFVILKNCPYEILILNRNEIGALSSKIPTTDSKTFQEAKSVINIINK
jgi:hypothetical protein